MGTDVRAVLDTSVVLSTNLPPLAGELAVSSLTLAELHFGVLIAKNDTVRGQRLQRYGQIEKLFQVLPFDEKVAASYGELATALVRHGRKVRSRTMDLLIAATARAHRAQLYTRNAADLEGLHKLVKVVTV